MAGASALNDETAAKVLRQVEYYFSDSSLPGDPFMLKKIEESEDGLVDLSLLCTFQKMRSHLDVKESDPTKFPAEKLAAVAEVLRSKSTFLRLSEDGKRVGRVHELKDPAVVQAEVDARSIAANPFPYKTSMTEVEVVFKPHAEVKSVRLAKHKNNKNIPSGFAVIEFSSEEEAQKVLKMELACQGVTLELEPKTTFDARKETLLENDKKNGEMFQKRERDSQDNDEYKKGLIVSFTAKKLGTGDETEKPAEAEKPAEETEKPAEETEKPAVSEKAADAADTEGGEEGEKLSREDIKGELTKFGVIRYVDYAKGDASGFLRFDQPEDAQKLVAAAAAVEPEGGLTIAQYLVTFQALEGEEEANYWKKVREVQAQKFGGGGRGGHNGRGRGRGGRGGRGGRRGRGHKRSNDGDGPKSKSQKTDS